MRRLGGIAAGLGLLVACGGGGGGVIERPRPAVIQNPPAVVFCGFGARPSAGLQADYWEQWCERGKKMTGPYERYTLEGVLVVKGDYEEDKPIGKWNFYYPGGERKVVGAFEDGSPVGEWEWRHENGETAQRGGYTQGVRSGSWVTWFDDRTKASEGSFVDGQRDGAWTFWNDQGQVMREQVWKNGTLVSNTAPEEAGIIE